MRKKSIAVIMMIMISVCVSIRAKAETADTVNDLILEFKDKTCCDSVSVVVYEKGKASFYGDKDSLYQIGSMTKAFTGLAVEKMMIEGLLSKDDTVSDLIPGFEAFYDGKKADITVDDLMRQRSGFTNSEKDFPSATEDMTLSEWVCSMSGKSLKSMPGSEYAYSNANYNILGAIIERVSGMTYPEYMENEILKPLGLNDTYVGYPSYSGNVIEGERLAYRNTFEYCIPVKKACIPAGYFYSDAKDMSSWIDIWTGTAEVSPPFRSAVDNIKSRLSDDTDYYSGWEKADDMIGHSGGTPNYSSRIVFSDNDDIGVCVLTNLNVSASTDSLCNGIIDIVKGRDGDRISNDVWTVFDIVFSSVTLVSIILFAAVFLIRKKHILIFTAIVLALLLFTMIILFPVIFSAPLREILFIWAPASLAGGMIMICADIIHICIRLFLRKNNADSNKTGRG